MECGCLPCEIEMKIVDDEHCDCAFIDICSFHAVVEKLEEKVEKLEGVAKAWRVVAEDLMGVKSKG